MPVVQIPLSNSADDARATLTGASYPPTGTAFITDGEVGIQAHRSGGANFRIQNAFLRFDSGSLIPDTATILSARLGLRKQNNGAADGLSIMAEYFSWTPPVVAANYTATPSGTAHAGTPLANLSANQVHWLDLLNPDTNISKTGYTGFRLHISQRASDAAPTGNNFLDFRTYEGWLADNTIQQPYLEVTYTTKPIHRGSASNGTPSGSAQSTLAVNKPAGLAVDDWMVMAVSFSGGTGATITPPTATGTWTLLTNGRQNSTTVLGQAVYAKKAVQADVDATNYTINLGANRKAAASIHAYYNCDGVGQSSGQVNAAAANVIAPSVNAETDSVLLYIGGINADATFTDPSGMTGRADFTGAAPAGAAAPKTLYLKGGTLTNGMQPMQEGGTSPDAAFATATGWIVAATAGGNYAGFRANTERAANQFSTTVQPNTEGLVTGAAGNAFRSPVAYTGTFASGNWTLKAVLRSVTAAMATGQTGTLRWRVYRSANADGTGATEITSATLESNTVAGTGNLTANQAVRTVTWAAPQITLTNEYLFFVCAYRIVATSGTGNTRDANFRQNTDSAVITTDFTQTDVLAQDVAEEWRQVAGATNTRTGVASLGAVNIGNSVTLIHPPPPDPAVLTPGLEYDPGIDYGALVELHGILAGFEGNLLPGEFPPGEWRLFEYSEREWGATLSAGLPDNVERIIPSSIISMVGLTGTLADIQDDPEDNTWLVVP